MFASISGRFADVALTRVSSLEMLAQAVEKQERLIPFISDGMLAFLSIALAVAMAIFIGRYIARSIRLEEYGTRLSVILGSVFLALLLMAANGFTPRFGIDLRGGINMVGSLNQENLGDSADGFGRKTEAKDIIPNLQRRVDPAGNLEIMIRPLGSDKIEVTIPTNNKAEADVTWERLVKTGKLQFLIVNEGRFRKHEEARRIALDMASKGDVSKRVGSVMKEQNGIEREMPLAKWFTIAKEDTSGQSFVPYKIIPNASMLLRDSRTGKVVDVNSIPIRWNNEDEARVEFTRWWQKNQPGQPQVLLMEPEDESMRVTGDMLDPKQLRIGVDERGRNSVNFGMTADGAPRMYDFTWEHKPGTEGKYLMAIVLDDFAHTWPTLESHIRHNGQIVGNFSRQEIDDLIINLRSGNIDVALNDNPISSDFIDSALGQELKQKGLYAIGLSLILVVLFMVFYYRFAGIVAAAALVLNIVFILALVMAIKQPLTLTGLAGLVLTVGMSVDANVLIYERIREELAKGAALRMAIRNGFDKAMATIIDANVTTLLTAVVLYVIGNEQLKGFSVTLILGILMSMFTAIYCSRAVFDIWERKRWLTRLSMIHMFEKVNYRFINMWLAAGLASVAVIGVGVAAVFGLQDRILHHDLRGGSTVRLVFKEPPDSNPDRARQSIVKALMDENVVIDGEKIEYSVSSLRTDEYPNRVFKIDSNVPGFDDNDKPSHEGLAELVARVFAGKLELHQVRIAGEEQPNPTPGPGDSGMRQQADRPQALAAIAALRPGAMLTSLRQTEPIADPNEQTGVDDMRQAETDQPQVPATEQQPGSAEDNRLLDGEADVLATSPGGQVYKTDLSFRFPVSGKELTTLLISAAEHRELELTNEQIVLNSPDAIPDEPISSVSSKNWTVELALPSTEVAASMVKEWAHDYNGRPYFPTTSQVGGQIARETQIQAAVAMLASLIGIIIYVWFRFQNVAFGLAAVVALVHDVLVVISAIAISHFIAQWTGFLGIEEFKISLPIVAALLTIIGYSLNDTIVIFDRIREVRGKRVELTAEIVDASISQTLSRTLLTSLTTFIVVFILYCFGGDAIHGFAFALVVGVVVGTYSTIFIACPVLLWLFNSVGLNPGEPIGLPDVDAV